MEALRAQCHAVCALKVFIMTKTLPHTKRQRWCTIEKARGKAAKVTNAGHPHHGHACGTLDDATDDSFVDVTD